MNSFGHLGGAQELCAGGDSRVHVGGFAVDRDLPRPGQREAAILAGPAPVPHVLGPLLLGQLAHDRLRHEALHEVVVLEHELLAGG
jgi:hypothetical protein